MPRSEPYGAEFCARDIDILGRTSKRLRSESASVANLGGESSPGNLGQSWRRGSSLSWKQRVATMGPVDAADGFIVHFRQESYSYAYQMLYPALRKT